MIALGAGRRLLVDIWSLSGYYHVKVSEIDLNEDGPQLGSAFFQIQGK